MTVTLNIQPHIDSYITELMNKAGTKEKLILQIAKEVTGV